MSNASLKVTIKLIYTVAGYGLFLMFIYIYICIARIRNEKIICLICEKDAHMVGDRFLFSYAFELGLTIYLSFLIV